MRVEGIEQREVAGGIEWSARLTFADQERTVRFGGPAELVADADASMFVAAALLPAMAWGQDLHVDGPVSPLLRSRVDRIARMYALMDPTLRPPAVTASEVVAPAPGRRGVAAMFSRGVDSTYTAAVARTEPGPLEGLVYCRTLEPAHSDAVAAEEEALAHQVAQRIGLPLHVIWTDLRTFTDPMFGWSSMHGAGLGALAMAVAGGFDQVVVATAYDVASLVPCGSHPAIDRLWGTEAVAVYHDDLDRSRQGKLDWLVAERPDLLALIKVCYADDRSDNCGTCHKCLLTMTGLRAAGGLHLATAFPSEVDLDAVRAQRVVGVGLRHLWFDIARRARDRGDDELADAVGDLLRHSAVPTLGELVRPRSRRPFDPERSAAFECFDRTFTDRELALLRHGEVLGPGDAPAPKRLRWSTLAGALEASLAHRRARARSRISRG